MKISQSLLVSKDGSKFWSSQTWQHFLTHTKHSWGECKFKILSNCHRYKYDQSISRVFFQIKFLAVFCHLAQLWVALGLPPSPRARAQLPHVDRGLPASVQCSGLYLLWLIQALLPTGWQKIAIWQPLEISIFSKSPMYFNVNLADFLTLRSSASSHRPHSLNTMNNSTQPVVCESSCLT